MFERFTQAARDVVRGANEAAEQAGDRQVTEEHLLRALLRQEGLPLLAEPERRDRIRADLDAARRRAGISRADAAALAEIGIDVEEIVGAVERAHGPGALGPQRSGGRRGRFSGEAKKVLERSLRVALGRGDKHIGREHLLLALVSGPGVAGEVLGENGVTYTAVEQALGGRAQAS
ncbi:Clp protease N-terminal domain-containing protein [Streptomyces sp. NPDC051940]|uniref:Clp protease N-terminal domain-containing protein n=1 Tax=Streptomyces sp. NPDC051940 TaxID=3155675 RepID=UPI0034180DE7